MARIKVVSSNIHSIGYENNTLEVCFLSGWVYHYYNVPEEYYTYMITHNHPGTFLCHYIKGCYQYKRVA